ncbi:Bud3 protein [Maudiozyma humilis]|uniref:Bud3 protein n=1 Tax=Maudiozyma humilis TaxID=51915 RepID=A0AAV5RZE3_MAUHU|nr:Bud3 protein [Kazachstania humilis]
MVTQDVEVVANDFSSLYSHDSITVEKHIDQIIHTTEVEASPAEPPSDDNQIVMFNNLLDALQSNPLKRNILTAAEKERWTQAAFDESVILTNTDKLFYGKFLICIHKNGAKKEESTYRCLIFDDFGLTTIEKLNISSGSPYQSAINALSAKDQKSDIKKCTAVALMQRFATLSEPQLKKLQELRPASKVEEYNNAYAAELASGCTEVADITPHVLGERILSQGYLGSHIVRSTLLDVIYQSSENTIELNNRLVFHLGEQLEQLFNPITEYSPEQTEYGYKIPEGDFPTEDDTSLIKAVCNELLEVQSNFTFTLVEFLQKFLIPLRVKVLNNDVEGLSTVKLNRLFPPTIDEVTRINCIFLDSLKSATPFGSFEVLSACNITIPYFYKAYTRHEAATKNFSKDIKLFLRNFSDVIPLEDVYSEMKLESIIRGPQEKILKLKLIIERLYKKKVWSAKNSKKAEEYYSNVIDVIDSFGHLEAPMSSYSTRVFTPSGKILTELAKGWPIELQYKWLKRRIVGVFDIINLNEPSKRKLLVIFSDYVVFLNIMDYKKYYTTDEHNNKPLISDILMNSLINEQPLPPKIPKLQVEYYSYIKDIHTSVTDENIIRFDSICKEDDVPFSVICKLTLKNKNANEVADLITKAKILEKDTAFHLFKYQNENMVLYFTAHELEAYTGERIKSKFALFLNIKPSEDILIENELHSAAFVKFVNPDQNNTVELDLISRNSNQKYDTLTIEADDLVPTLLNLLSKEIPLCYSSISSDDAIPLTAINGIITTKLMGESNPETSSSSRKPTPNISNDLNEETKKSYGTITTFRSDVSDLVNVPVNDQAASPDKENITSTKPVVTKTSEVKSVPKKVSPQPRQQESPKKKKITKKTVAKEEKHPQKKKRNGFFGAIKNVFSSGNNGNKSKKTISNPILVKPKKQTKPKSEKIKNKPLPNSPVKTKNESKEKSKPDSPVNKTRIEEPQPEKTEVNINQRISSVIHNIGFNKSGNQSDKGDGNEKIADKEESHKDQDPTTPIELPVGKDTDNHLSETAANTNKSSVEVNPPSPVSIKLEQNDKLQQLEESLNAKVDQVNVGDDTEERLAHPIGHQGQLFDDDLFGDFSPDDVKKSKKITSQENDTMSKERDVPSTDAQSKLSTDQIVPPPNESAQKSPLEENIPSAISIDHDDKNTENEIEPSPMKKKTPIFPEIAKVEPPKSQIKFQKSPSFIELFRDMRTVLDDTDAKYNWKSLSSEVSLNEKYLVNNGATEEHNTLEPITEQSQSLPRPTSPAMKFQTNTSASPTRQSPVRSEGSPFRALAHHKISEISSSPVRQQPTANINIPVLSNNQSEFTASPTFQSPQKGSPHDVPYVSSRTPSPTRPGAIFKVISTSPSKFANKMAEDSMNDVTNRVNEQRRIVNKSSMGLGLSSASTAGVRADGTFQADDKNAYSDFTFASINNDTNNRLVKLQVNSKEELADETYHTPLEEPSETFSEGMFEKFGSPSSSTMKLSQKAVSPQQKTQIPASNNTNIHQDTTEEDDDGNILDDLEFSSFDMTFGTTNGSSNTQSPVASDKKEQGNIMHGLRYSHIPKMDPPVMYRYTRDSAVDNKSSPNTARSNVVSSNRTTSTDDDPFWISPSKLDFTSVANSAKKNVNNQRTLDNYAKQEVAKKESPTQQKMKTHPTESTLSHDMSFAFLGNLVELTSTDDGNERSKMYAGDKPTRLHFN